jgi:tRNA(Ile)-lysidine synthase
VHELSRSVLSYIGKQDLLHAGDRAGVAVSGGADSVALLRILLELRAELGIVLSVVHLNHCLRGEESEDDEQSVRDLAGNFVLPFFSARRDVKGYAAEKKLSVEAAARELRYQYFEELLRNGEFNKLATAHTLDDQAETVLLKLARGAGTRGLAGIYPHLSVKRSQEEKLVSPSRELAIIRPLISVQRGDLEPYLHKIQQPWREDSTNAQLHHTRNRVRHEILPRLCAEVNPQVRRTLAEVAEIARAEEEFWQSEIQRHLSGAWSQNEQGGILCSSLLKELPLALRRRVVRAAAESLGLCLEFKHVEEILMLSENTRALLPDGWIVRRLEDLVYFGRSLPAAVQDYEYRLPVPGRVEVPQAGLAIDAILQDKNHYPSYNSHHLLDSRFAEGLLVRNWRAGDRFWPVHSKASKKIKELLQDRHITGDEKKTWPVIASGEDIVWLRGFGVRRDSHAQNSKGILISEESLEP